MEQLAALMALGAISGLFSGLLGIGGGIVIVPALVYLLGMDQHIAQGTSLFILLPPLGLGALAVYWKKHEVDLRAGIVCAVGFLLGGYFGGRIALGISSRVLQSLFGVFLMFSAAMLWRQSRRRDPAKEKHA